MVVLGTKAGTAGGGTGSLSGRMALVIGTVELLQVLSTKLALTSGFWSWLNGLDFGQLGYGIVGLFVLTWAVSAGIWKARITPSTIDKPSSNSRVTKPP